MGSIYCCRFFLTLLIVFCLANTSALSNNEKRNFDEVKLKQYLEESAYIYEPVEKRSILDDFKTWLIDTLNALFNVNEKKASIPWGTVFEVFAWGVGLFAAFMIFRTFFQGAFSKLFNRTKHTAQLEIHDLENFDENIDYLALVEQEKSQKRFNNALRLYYLYLIKQLKELKLIKWQKDRTNREYMRQLRNTTLLKPFQSITHFYEYVWYGDFDIDEALFRTYSNQIDDFILGLKQLERV